MELTIAIPTYNRNELLLKHLRLLLPQLTSRCRLLIFDNCSPTPVEQTLEQTLEEYPEVQCQIIRNRINIGANANILRCLETCETGWIWILGDDDVPLPGAIELALQTIDANPEAVYLNFAFDGLRPAAFSSRGLEGFADKLDASANVPWISTAVCNAPLMQPQLKIGYQYAYSMLPHVAILLMSLGTQGVCFFAKDALIDINQANDGSTNEQWSRVDLALGSPVLYDLPLGSQVREKIAAKLLVTHQGQSIKLRVLLHQLLLMSVRHKDPQTSFYLYDQIRRRGYHFEKRPGRRLSLLLGWLMLRVPRLVFLGYRIVKRKNFLKENLRDRYERI